MNRITKDNVEEAFTYHAVTGRDQQMAYDAVRDGCIALARTFLSVLPEGDIKSAALTRLWELRMFANAAIATAHIPDFQHDVHMGMPATDGGEAAPSNTQVRREYEDVRPRLRRPSTDSGSDEEVRPIGWVPPYRRF